MSVTSADLAIEEAYQEEQEELKREKPLTGRVLDVVQFFYNPDDYEYERDDKGQLLEGYPKLKEGATPLITEETIQKFMARFHDNKEIAYIIHDKDTYTAEEAQRALENGTAWRVREGEPKPKHGHIVIRSVEKENAKGNKSRSPIRVSTIAKALGVPENAVEIVGGRDGFAAQLAYLIHQTLDARTKGKYQYDRKLVHANFDWEVIANRYILKKVKAMGEDIKFGKWVENLDMGAKNYKLLLWLGAVRFDGIGLDVVKERVTDIYLMNEKRFKEARSEYLANEAPLPLVRLNFLITGKPGTGKTEMAYGLARSLFPNREDDKVFFETGTDKVTFQHYDGQPVIIWADAYGSEIARQFKRQQFINMIDTTPHGEAHDKKYGSVRLLNSVNIFCTVEDYQTFMFELNQMTDDNIKQVYRRIPFIMPVREDDFDIMINLEFLQESNNFREYEIHQKILGSVSKIRKGLQNNKRLEKLAVGQVVDPAHRLANRAASYYTEDNPYFEELTEAQIQDMYSDLTQEEQQKLAQFASYGQETEPPKIICDGKIVEPKSQDPIQTQIEYVNAGTGFEPLFIYRIWETEDGKSVYQGNPETGYAYSVIKKTDIPYILQFINEDMTPEQFLQIAYALGKAELTGRGREALHAQIDRA